MTKYIIAFVCFLQLTLAATAASSGSALISPWELTRPYSTNWMLVQIYVSNITTESIDVKLSLISSMDANGNPVYYSDTDNSPATGVINAYGNFSNYTETASGASVALQIPPLQTVKVVVVPPTTISGALYLMFGKIDWSGPSNLSVALIGRLHVQHNNNDSSIAAVALNQGNPF